MMDCNSTADMVLEVAAISPDMNDETFVVVSRALRGVDPLTGDALSLPERMVSRGWRKSPASPVETGRNGGWWWRCPRKSCTAWDGPFRSETAAREAGREAHGLAHERTRR